MHYLMRSMNLFARRYMLYSNIDGHSWIYLHTSTAWCHRFRLKCLYVGGICHYVKLQLKLKSFSFLLLLKIFCLKLFIPFTLHEKHKNKKKWNSYFGFRPTWNGMLFFLFCFLLICSICHKNTNTVLFRLGTLIR